MVFMRSRTYLVQITYLSVLVILEIEFYIPLLNTVHFLLPIIIETHPNSIRVFCIFSQICHRFAYTEARTHIPSNSDFTAPSKSFMIHRSAMASCMSQCSPVRKLGGKGEIAIRIERSRPFLPSTVLFMTESRNRQDSVKNGESAS